MRRTVAALIALLLPAVAAAQPSPTFTNLTLTGTGAAKLNVGTTGQRPDTGNAGEVRYNSTTGLFEFGAGGSWVNFLRTTGGTLTGGLTLSAGTLAVAGTGTFATGSTVAGRISGGGATATFTCTQVVNCGATVTSVGTGNVLLQAPTSAASSGWLALNGTLSLKQNVVYTAGTGITTGGLSPASFWLDVANSGTNNTGAGNPWFARFRDTVVESGNSGSAQPFAFDHEYNAGADGTRNSFQIVLNKNVASASGSNQFNALQVFSHILAGEGGVGPSTYRGVVWAFNPDISVQTGADYYDLVHNTEFDLRVYAGNHVNAKVIGDFHFGALDAVHGASGNDTAIGISSSPLIAPGTGGGLQAIAFGQYNQAWPIDPNASGTALITVQPNVAHNLDFAWQPTATYGVNLSGAYFGTAAWWSSGFQVDGNGQVMAGPAKLTYSLNTATLDVPNVAELTAVVAAAGGSGYLVGDTLEDPIGGLWTVATLSGSGATAGVATVTLLRTGYGTCPGAGAVTTGGNGAGATITITCSAAARQLQLGPTVNTLIGSGSALATNATSGFVQLATMAGAPTGTVGAAGQAAMVIDTTNKKICYSTGGGTWECSGAFTP